MAAAPETEGQFTGSHGPVLRSPAQRNVSMQKDVTLRTSDRGRDCTFSRGERRGGIGESSAIGAEEGPRTTPGLRDAHRPQKSHNINEAFILQNSRANSAAHVSQTT